MLLAIDVGNSNAVLGCVAEGKIQKTWRLSTRPVPTSDEFRIQLHSLLKLEGIDPSAFRSVVVSSVVPNYTTMLRGAFPTELLKVIDWKWPFSFEIAADPASQVGADRLVNAEAAVRTYGFPVIIVDSGTATTICAVGSNRSSKNSKPVYLGGAIMPGIELSIEALAGRTAKLFSVELVAPKTVIGHNTQTALQSGLMFGYANMIDGMVRRFKEELQKRGDLSPKVIATGGISRLLKGLATELDFFDDELTLRGISGLYGNT